VKPTNGVAKLGPQASIRRSMGQLEELRERLRVQRDESALLAARTARRAPHIIAATPHTNGRPRVS
jgi:hypothetical protein